MKQSNGTPKRKRLKTSSDLENSIDDVDDQEAHQERHQDDDDTLTLPGERPSAVHDERGAVLHEGEERMMAPPVARRRRTPSFDASDADNATITKTCPHIAQVDIDGIRDALLDPSNWSCKECNHTESCWACLRCGYVGCGRYQESHALAHYTATQHPIVFEINSKYCHCYECDAYLENDNKRGDLESLRIMIEQLQTHTISESRTRSGRLLKSSSHVKLHPRDHTSDDRVSTAVKHWQLYTMSRAFSQWRWFVETHRQEGISPDHRPRAPGFSLFSTELRSIAQLDREQTAPQATDAWEFREENEADEDDHILLLDGAGRAPTTETALEDSNDQGESAITAPLPGVVRSSSGILKRSGKASGSLKRARVSWKTHELIDEDTSTKDSVHKAPECDQLPDVGASDGNGASNESPKKRKYHDEDSSDQETYTPTAENTGGSADDASTEGAEQAGEKKDDDDIVTETPQSSKENASQPTRRAKRRKGLLADLDMDGPAPRPQAMFLSPVARRNLVPGQTGLRNLGNTCFMNAVLQALSNTLQFRDYFVVDFLPKDKKGKLWRRKTIDCLKQITAQQPPVLGDISISAEIHNIFRVVWSGRWAVVTPFALLDALWKFVPRFRNYQQQDAQEFLVYLLDKLHDELTSLQGNGPSPLHDLKKSESIISRTFRGELSSQVTCSCGNISTMREPYLDLSLDLPVQHAARSRTSRGRASKDIPSCNLYDCFDSFTRAEELSDYFCEKCKSRQDATKRFVIQTLPDVLCIVLKRFCWTTTTRAKVDTKVVFPLIGLDLSAFSREDREDAIFDLQSVVIHHGSGPNAGHYTAFCFHAEQDTWLHFNDSKVSVSSPQEVASAQAYLLFYQRRSAKNDKFSLPSLIPAPSALTGEGNGEEEDEEDEEEEDDEEEDKKESRSKRKRRANDDEKESGKGNSRGKGRDGSAKRPREKQPEEEEASDEEELDLDSLSRDELKNELRKRGLKTGGAKAELLRRLKAAVSAEDRNDEEEKDEEEEEEAEEEEEEEEAVSEKRGRGNKKSEPPPARGAPKRLAKRTNKQR